MTNQPKPQSLVEALNRLSECQCEGCGLTAIDCDAAEALSNFERMKAGLK